MRILVLVTMMWLAAAASGRASTPTNETFDTLLVGSAFQTPQRGWSANAASIVVTATRAQSGANSVDVNGGTMSNSVNAGAVTGVLWTEFHLIPQWGAAPVDAATNVVSHLHYYNTNGYMTILTASGFVTVTQDIHGVAIAPVDTNEFARISLYQNFNTATSAVLLNGVVVLQDLAFPGTSPNYNTFAVQNAEVPSSYFDTYSVGSTVPAGADGNSNGTPDTVELNTLGYVARNFIVGSTPGAHFTSLAAAAAAARSGDTITIAGTPADAGTATFHANVTVSGADFTTTAGLVVATGYTLTLDGIDVRVSNSTTLNGALVIGPTASFSASTLTMGASGLVDANGGTWSVDTPLLAMTGTFEISGADYNAANFTASLNFAETFEPYAQNVPIDHLRFRGWGAADTGSIITNVAGQQGSRSARVSGVVSNRINGAGATAVWTDFHIYALKGVKPTSAETAGSSVLLYFTTNGFLAAYDSGVGDYTEFTTDAGGHPVTPIADGAWARVSLFTHYGQDKAAIFLNDRLMRDQLPFPGGNASSYSGFSVDNREPATVVFDDLDITQDMPGDLNGDVDGDSVPDAVEINAYGTIATHGFPATVFRFL